MDRASWCGWPAEIRRMILQVLLQDSVSLASLACVSREWQTVIEPHNFARIKLTSSRLADFGSVTRRNRGLVRYIWLCLELEKYDCTQCASVGDLGLSEADHLLIATAFQDLFSTLSTWKPGNDLVLDISVHSPSDAEHWFKYLTVMPDARSDQGKDRWDPSQWEDQLKAPNFKDCHSGLDPRKFERAITNVFDELIRPEDFDTDWLKNEWWDQLPLVPAVTGVLLRQQTRRRWSPRALKYMFARLPMLQEIHYESWREWGEPILQRWTDECK